MGGGKSSVINFLWLSLRCAKPTLYAIKFISQFGFVAICLFSALY